MDREEQERVRALISAYKKTLAKYPVQAVEVFCEGALEAIPKLLDALDAAERMVADLRARLDVAVQGGAPS